MRLKLMLSEWFPDIVSLSDLVGWETWVINPPLSDNASIGEVRGSMGIPSLATKSWSMKPQPQSPPKSPGPRSGHPTRL